MALTITKDTYPELSLDPREVDKFNASDPDTQQMYLTQWRVSAVLVVFWSFLLIQSNRNTGPFLAIFLLRPFQSTFCTLDAHANVVKGDF